MIYLQRQVEALTQRLDDQQRVLEKLNALVIDAQLTPNIQHIQVMSHLIGHTRDSGDGLVKRRPVHR
jgi:hypothetical protein